MFLLRYATLKLRDAADALQGNVKIGEIKRSVLAVLLPNPGNNAALLLVTPELDTPEPEIHS